MLFQWSQNPPADIKRAAGLAQKAVAADDSNSRALALVSTVDQLEGRPDQGIEDGERAVALNPNYAIGYWVLGSAVLLHGKPEEAISSFQKAIRLDPESESVYSGALGIAYLLSERYQQAVPSIEKHVAAIPNDIFARSMLAIAYSELGRGADARNEASEIMRRNPQYRLPAPRIFSEKADIGATLSFRPSNSRIEVSRGSRCGDQYLPLRRWRRESNPRPFAQGWAHSNARFIKRR